MFSKMNPIKDKLLTKPQFLLLLKSFSIVSLLNTNGLINFNFTKPFTPLMFKCDSPTSEKVAALKRPIFQFAFLAKANPRQEPEISETSSSHSQPTSNKGINGVDSLPSAPSHDQPGAHDFDRLAGLFFESFRTSKTIDHQLLADLLKTCPVDAQGQILGKVMYDKLKSYLGKIFANPGQQFKLIYKTYCEPGEEVLFKPHSRLLSSRLLLVAAEASGPEPGSQAARFFHQSAISRPQTHLRRSRPDDKTRKSQARRPHHQRGDPSSSNGESSRTEANRCHRSIAHHEGLASRISEQSRRERTT